jgi:murein DD-endopeptidase MepM/ murein hydrolase activator NlpD
MHMTERRKYIGLVLSAALVAVVVFMASNFRLADQPIAKPNVIEPQIAGAATSAIATEIQVEPKLSMPISGGLVRVTKKPFGLHVSPESSPVENDIFTGFHTGIDFETFPNEANMDVVITAACDGKVLIKEWAKGYGGVLVQACQIEGQDFTIIYGHLKLDSITSSVGQTLVAGERIGILGQAQSHDTDGRRKHLHFDIHKGTEIDIHGYVQTQEDLDSWIDPVPYL